MARLGAVAFGAFGAFGAMFFAGCGGTEVQGIVREEGTGEPLSGALVQVGGETARTDEGGAFELEVDDDAPALLEVEAIGYEPQKIDVNMDDGRALPSDVSLKKESEERQQTRARFAEERERLEAQEEKIEAEERQLFEARRDFMRQRGAIDDREQTRQQLESEQKRLEEAEAKHEAEERALYEARRDFETGAIDTWTAPARTEQAVGAEEDADEASEEAADRVRKADEEAAERAEEARDER